MLRNIIFKQDMIFKTVVYDIIENHNLFFLSFFE